MKIQNLAFLLLLQSLIACMPEQEKASSMAVASMGFSPVAVSFSDSAKTKPVAGKAIFQSTDGGKTWQDISAGLPAGTDVQGVFVHDNDVFVSTGAGLFHSKAATNPVWEKAQAPAGQISDVAPGRGGLYVSSYHGGLFLNIPAIGLWNDLSNTLEDKSIRTVLETPDGALLLGTDTGIFKSADGGRTWKQVFDGGLVLNLVASGNILIGGGQQGVLRSTDGGDHWTLALDENILAKKTGLLKDRFVTILGTRDPTKINPDGITSRLRVSADGGKTWKRLEEPMLPLSNVYDMDEDLSEVLDIYDIVQVGNDLFCSFNTGIYRSSDQGKRWELVFPSDGKRTYRLAVSGKVVYAAVGGGC